MRNRERGFSGCPLERRIAKSIDQHYSRQEGNCEERSSDQRHKMNHDEMHTTNRITKQHNPKHTHASNDFTSLSTSDSSELINREYTN